MYKLRVTRDIAGAHYLPDYEGKCRTMHGHTWTVEVLIAYQSDLGLTGLYLAKTGGLIVDFRLIKETIDLFDHVTLNDLLPVPTAEHLASELYWRLTGHIGNWLDCDVEGYTKDLGTPKVEWVRVWESKECYAEYAPS